jgi:hypothetical protein
MGRGEVNTEFRWGNPRERQHLEKIGIDGRIVSQWIFRKYFTVLPQSIF